MNEKVMFSSKNLDWTTPIKLFNLLDHEFGFNLDVCATEENTLCNNYMDKEDNCLISNWEDFASEPGIYLEKAICFMNPPYGRELIKFIEKAYWESVKGCLVVCLIPARTDTKWWWNYCLKAYEIRFIKGRLKFGNAENSAPFPSAIVIFNESKKEFNNQNPVITWWKI